MTTHCWPARLGTSALRLLVAVAACVALAPAVSIAQPAAALGHPLPASDLPDGTVTVRVIAGSTSAAVIGTDVTLLIAGKPEVARTDASGHVKFSNLTAGTTVQAKVTDENGKDILSDEFPVPESGGVKVMLSTKPFTGGMGGGAPFAGGAGMPEPRKISGQPRRDNATPPGTYVVRLTYNDLTAKAGDPDGPPQGLPVTLVGYAADDSVTVRVEKSDLNGRVSFDNLDPSGSIAYFALAALPRDAGVDRVYALPLQLDSQSGYRALLSGEKKDSKKPFVDQYATPQSIPTPPGKVRVTLEGIPPDDAKIQLIDAATHAVVAELPAAKMEADPTTVQGGSKFEAKKDLPAGTIEVTVHGGIGTDGPLGDVEIRVIASDASQLEDASVKTGADGKVTVTASPEALKAKQQRAVFRILGRDFVSEPFDVSKAGGTLDITAKWSSQGRPQAMFDVPYKPGQVLYAETTIGGKLAGTYRSIPVMPAETAGTHLGIVIYPRLMLKFRMRADVDDRLLAVQGLFQVQNNSWIPYRDTTEGMLIPLPEGFKGGILADSDQASVAVVPDQGFRIMRPLAPMGTKSFVGGFSLPVDDSGASEWKLDLPLGTVGSMIQIHQTPGLHVDAPLDGQILEGKDGLPYYVLDKITIGRNRSMVMNISGLPTPEGWKIWAPRIVGVVVVLLLLGGLGFALFGRHRVEASSALLAKKNAMLEELVQLERSGADTPTQKARREQLMKDLEKIWDS